jgi:hypothetical protein
MRSSSWCCFSMAGERLLIVSVKSAICVRLSPAAARRGDLLILRKTFLFVTHVLLDGNDAGYCRRLGSCSSGCGVALIARRREART